MPTLIDPTPFLQVLAAGNLGGRIGWAAFSDIFGRRVTFNMFCIGSIPLYLAVPYTVQQVVSTGVSNRTSGIERPSGDSLEWPLPDIVFPY